MKLRYLAIAAIVAMGVGGVATYQPPDPAPSVVKLQLEQGHGSAVHIGGGYFVTAAHVTGGNAEIDYLTFDGDTGVVMTLWENTDYDIALVYDPDTKATAVDIDCRDPVKGERISFTGNPLNMNFLTSWGETAGNPVKIDGFWENVYPVDGTIINGMSGGGAFDSGGDLIGINVGVMQRPMGFVAAPIGFGFIVPASDICFLMGRG